jgi:hypothetical protein
LCEMRAIKFPTLNERMRARGLVGGSVESAGSMKRVYMAVNIHRGIRYYWVSYVPFFLDVLCLQFISSFICSARKTLR